MKTISTKDLVLAVLKGGIIIAIAGSFVYINFGYLQAQFARNLAWISLVDSIASPLARGGTYNAASRNIDNALLLDPDQPRLAAAGDWFDRFQNRAQEVQKNQSDRLQIQAAIQCYVAGESNCSRQEQALISVANQSEDMEAWLVLAYASATRGDYDSLNQILANLSNRDPQFTIANNFTYENLRLEGYDWLPLSQERYPKNRIALYWQSDDYLSVSLDPGTGVYQWDKRLVQVFETENLIANGDFEWISLSDKSNLPYPWILAILNPRLNPSVRIISDASTVNEAVSLYEEHSPLNTTHLQLQKEEEGIFLYTVMHDLAVGSPYFLVGRTSAVHDTRLQIMQTVNNVNQHPLIIQCPAAQVAQSCGGIFSIQDEGTVYLQLHYDGPTSSTVNYDDLGLFKITSPSILE